MGLEYSARSLPCSSLRRLIPCVIFALNMKRTKVNNVHGRTQVTSAREKPITYPLHVVCEVQREQWMRGEVAWLVGWLVLWVVLQVVSVHSWARCRRLIIPQRDESFRRAHRGTVETGLCVPGCHHSYPVSSDMMPAALWRRLCLRRAFS
ncbi:hypothetical protein F5141DRAFT_570090 [Pisolithus sp. B1]|nr:hypothetical protein F5141DRAFT_570090 [Pisolithus sp. B1]